jgi:prepilin-type N-terminal cleavage/methylation domain-containing protein
MKRSSAGFSLIELMVSIAIMAVAVAATASVIVTLMSMTRNAENYTEDMDRARMGGLELVKAIEAAGLMTPAGLYPPARC